MDKERLYEQIEAYLNGALPQEARDMLERQMASDPALAAEVELHRRMQAALSDPQKMAFRRQLDELAKEFPPPAPPGGSGFRTWWLAPPILLIALLAIWRISTSGPETPPPPPPPVTRDTVKIATPPDTLKTPPTASKTAPQLPFVPSAFEPNPELEQAVLQKPDPYFNVKDARLDRTPADTIGLMSTLAFFGKMYSAMAVPELQITLLDNSLPQGKPKARIPVEITPLDSVPVIAFGAKKAYRLKAVRELKLKPGLYYGQLQAVNDGKVLWTGKLRVQR